MQLEGKRLVIVGASAGIGRAFAVRAVGTGARVVLGARRGDVLDEVRAEAGGGDPVTVDVRDPASREAFVAGVAEHLGSVDLLVCTVGYAELHTLADTDDDGWDRTVSTNLVGLSRLLAELLPVLAPTGVVAVLSSETAAEPRRGLVPYAASKAALEAVLRGLRVEHPGTRVSCVVVGATAPTEFGVHFSHDELGPSMASWQAHGLLHEEYMDPDEVAGSLVGLFGTALTHPGVCIEDVVLRSPSPVLGATPHSATHSHRPLLLRRSERRTNMTDVKNDLGIGEQTTTVANGDNGGLPGGLPMPRDPDLLFEMDRRPRVTHFEGERYPFPVPNGWFVVAEAADIGPGEVRSLYYFGRDLVLYRTADGAARLMDAHCTHLGAHLGVGGRVEEACLRCPFHGWKFDGESGECQEIPYGDVTRIPPKAHSRSYPTLERNHMIWAWYHAEGGEPFYDVPEVPEFQDDDWTPIVVRDFQVNVAAQDMAENNVDFAHFRYVHGTDAIPEDEFITEGTYKKAVGNGGDFVREGFGLGLGVLRVKGFVTFLSSTTPIDNGSVHVRWIFTAPKANGEEGVLQAADAFCAGVSQDIPIWENKVYRDPPVITKTEKLILEHRRWAKQFYCGADDEEGGRS